MNTDNMPFKWNPNAVVQQWAQEIKDMEDKRVLKTLEDEMYHQLFLKHTAQFIRNMKS